MGVYAGPDLKEDGLVFALDVANQKCISPLGCTGFNGAPQLVRNLVSPSDVITDANGVKLGNLSYYTVFAIDYPEGSFGGSAANRDGITPGFNVTSGTKTFDFGRALNYAVYNNPTQSWVKTTVYDSYVGTVAVDTFVAEYATAVATYPDAIHIVAGSHRDSYHTTAQYNILRDLGAPSNVDSIIGFSSPEWILVGKPGLGAGNAYGWAFQNYSTNPSQVAHLNFGLPIYGTKDNYLGFDGTDDVINATTSAIDRTNGQEITVSCWIKPSRTSGQYSVFCTNRSNDTSLYNWIFYQHTNDGAISFHGAGQYKSSYVPTTNVWINVTNTVTASGVSTLYVNGVSTYTVTGYTYGNGTPSRLGIGADPGGQEPFQGNIAQVQIYNRALTASEVQQNFNATRSRFGV